MNKTDTIKKRTIYVYLPSEKMVKDWKDRAKKYKVSISKFVMEHVESSLAKEKRNSSASRIKLLKKIKNLEEENKKIKEDNEMLRIVIDKQKQEIEGYRHEKFLEPEFTGKRGYGKDILDILKKNDKISNEELLLSLKIESKDTESIKAINKELEHLEEY